MRFQKLTVLTLASIALSSFSAHATVTLFDKDDWKVGFYGFVETDAIFDTTRSLAETIGNSPVDRPSTYAGDNGRTQYSMRNSRLGFSVAAPKWSDWQTQGIMEFDFLGTNGGSTTTPEATLYNNPVLRTRHFYMRAEANGWQLLAGQYWTLFGWQPAYFLVTLSFAPVSGMVYQRTAQFTAIKTVELGATHLISVGASLVRPAQRDVQLPGIDVGVRWEWKGRKSGFVGMTSAEPKAQPMSIGLSGRLNQFEYNGTSDTVSTTHMMGSALAIDALLPIIGVSAEDNTGNTLTLTGELTTGQGYSEAFPSFTGNLPAYSSGSTPSATNANNLNTSTNLNIDAGQIGSDPTNGVTLVHLTTFNLQLQYHLPSEWATFATLGYGQIYSNNIDPLKTASFVYDRDETYFFNVGHNFGKQIRVAGELDLERTTYSDGIVGANKRFQASVFYYF